MDERGTTAATHQTPVDLERPDQPALGRGAVAATGFAGLLFWITGLLGFPDGPPMATATAQQVRDHVVAQGTSMQGSALVGMVGVAAGMVFVAALVRQVRDRLPTSLLAEVVFASGLLVVIYQWLVITAEALPRLLPNLIESDLASVDDATLQGWYGLTGFTHFLGDLAVVPMIVLMGAFAFAARRGGLLPKWLTWTSLGLAGAGVLGMVGILAEVEVLYPFWFVGLFGFFLWILAVSLTCLVRLRRLRSGPSR
jgi:hypothetical protein